MPDRPTIRNAIAALQSALARLPSDASTGPGFHFYRASHGHDRPFIYLTNVAGRPYNGNFDDIVAVLQGALDQPEAELC